MLVLVANAWISLAAPLSVIPLFPAKHRHKLSTKPPLLKPAATSSCHSRLLTHKVDVSDARIGLQGSRQPLNPFVSDPFIPCKTQARISTKPPLVDPAATLSWHSRLLTAKVDLCDARILLQGSRQPRNPFVTNALIYKLDRSHSGQINHIAEFC